MTKKKAKRKSGRLQKGEKKGRELQRVKKYKRKQQEKKKGKKPKKCVMAYSKCGRCGELRFDDKINLCANCGYRILRTSKSYE